jgi:hypothetical protein
LIFEDGAQQDRICQLIVEQLESEPTLEIATAFQGQTSPSGKKA